MRRRHNWSFTEGKNWGKRRARLRTRSWLRARFNARVKLSVIQLNKACLVLLLITWKLIWDCYKRFLQLSTVILQITCQFSISLKSLKSLGTTKFSLMQSINLRNDVLSSRKKSKKRLNMSSLSRTANVCNAKNVISSTLQVSSSSISSIANRELVPSALQVAL